MKILEKISLLSTLVLFLSCDLLVNKPDGDLMKDIEDSVWEANAPRLQVTMDYIAGAGTSSPAKGLINPQPKQRIEFGVSFAANPDYGFVEWRAFQTGQRPETEEEWLAAAASLAKILRFESPRDLSTQVTIDSDTAQITLEPFCVRRPEVDHSDPVWTGSSNRFYTNQPIRIWFTMPIDSASVENFTNIGVTGVTYQGAGATVDLVAEGYFKSPVLEDKTLLLIEPNLDRFSNGILPNSDISVLLGINIRHDGFTDIDAGAGLRMARPFTITYGTSGGPDKYVPEVHLTRGAETEEDAVLFRASDKKIIHYRQNKAEVYLIFNAYKPTETSIRSVNIYEESESGQGTSSSVDEMFWNAGGRLESLYVTEYGSQSPPLGGGRTKVKYTIRTESPELVNLYILPEDTLGNKVSLDEARTKNYFMPLKIDPPPLPVTGLNTAYDKTGEKITLKWNRPANETDDGDDSDEVNSLKIEWKKNGVDAGVREIAAIEQEYIAGICEFPGISGANEDEYSFTIRALDGYENYSLSAPVKARADAKPPAAVTELKAAYNGGTISLTWNDPAAADLKDLRLFRTRGGSPEGDPATIAKGVKTYTLNGVPNDSSVYEFTIIAFDESGNESPSAVTGISLGGAAVYVPPVTGLSASYDAGAQTITANWTNPADSAAFTGLTVAWSNGAGVSGSVDLGKVNTRSISGIANNSGTYTITVTAKNGSVSSSSASARSDPAAAPPPVTGLTAGYNAGAQTITANWTNPADSSAITGL
ncbi:MAG: hypothetical protein LBS57_13760, partial [Treponema sp.]|nr:hypothetical protein [Treponema sp.]